MEAVGFPATQFYSGSTKKEFFRFHEKRKKKRTELEAEYKKRPLPSVTTRHRNVCFSEHIVYEWFPRQQEALDFCTKKTAQQKNLCLFAREKKDGKRKFLVTTRRQFWERYKNMEPSTRHFYEVIRLTDPCRLYFDIEFKHEFNQKANGLLLLENFISYVCYCLYKEFRIICSRKRIVDLCSSTDSKFSRHLIFHFQDGSLFRDNIQCGEFIKDMYRCLKEYTTSEQPNKFLPMKYDVAMGKIDNKESLQQLPWTCLSLQQLRELLVKTETGESFLCDLAVYTRNRNFRLYLSSKVSKHVPLIIAKECQFRFKREDNAHLNRQMRSTQFDVEYEQFIDTMICPAFTTKLEVINYGSRSSTSDVSTRTKLINALSSKFLS